MPYSIGCDVGKRTLDVVVMRETHDVEDVFRVPNDPSGHAEILRRLEPFRGCARVILEATGHYHLGLAFALVESGHAVTVLNPLLMKKFASSGIRKTKTDKIDAKLLAKIGFLEPHLKPFTETRVSIERKQLSQLIGKLKRDRRSTVQRLHQIEETKEVCPDVAGYEIASLRAIIRVKDEEIVSLEKRLLAFVRKSAELLATIPGVSRRSGARIAAELGDVSRFTDRDQVTAFAGLDPAVKESGTSVHRRGRITKRGSSELRCVLGQTAWGVMMHNALFKAYAQKKKAEGKHYFSVLVSVAKKLLLVMYAMLRNGTPYDPNYSRAGLTAV